MLDLRWSAVDLSRGTVLVLRSKTGRGREVPLTTRAREAFQEVHATRPPTPLHGEDLVFAREFEFRRVVRGLGMAGVSPHTPRRSCASRTIMAGVPLSAVARVTGHSTLRCAALYGKHAPRDAARMAIRALEGAGEVHRGAMARRRLPTTATRGEDRARPSAGPMTGSPPAAVTIATAVALEEGTPWRTSAASGGRAW